MRRAGLYTDLAVVPPAWGQELVAIFERRVDRRADPRRRAVLEGRVEKASLQLLVLVNLFYYLVKYYYELLIIIYYYYSLSLLIMVISYYCLLLLINYY